MSGEKLVPELRFNEFDDEWESVKLGDILTFYPTNSFSREKMNYDCGSVKNIHYGDIHTKFPSIVSIQNNNDIPFINNDIDVSKFKQEQYLQDGDLIIADASEDYEDIGKAIEVKDINGEKVLAGLHTLLARDEKKKTVNGFKADLFLTNPLKTNIKIIANGVSVLGISKKDLSKLFINIPSKEEQQKIVNFISNVDKKIDLLKKRSEEYNKFKKYFMQRFFTEKIGFTEFNEEWVLLKGKDVFKLIGGGSFNSSDSQEKGVKWLKIANVGVNTIKTNDISFLPIEFLKTYEKYVLREGDIVIALTGSILDHKLKIAIIDKEFDNSLLNQRVGKLEINEDVDSKFIYYYLQSYSSICYLESRIAGSAPPNLSNKDLLNIPIFLPSKEEQVKISGTLTNLDNKINFIDYNISKYDEFKKFLLQKMFV